MLPFLQWVVGAIVWGIANAVYVDMRRGGRRGFGRFAAFWAGFPTNLLWRAVVPEGSRIEPSADDEEQLLREVRMDREKRALGETDT